MLIFQGCRCVLLHSGWNQPILEVKSSLNFLIMYSASAYVLAVAVALLTHSCWLFLFLDLLHDLVYFYVSVCA